MTAEPAAVAARALPLLDLTSLNEDDDEARVHGLCTRAVTPYGPVAALCVWPWFTRLACDALAGAPVAVATVANFPEGGTEAGAVADEVTASLEAGAGEIDLVLPWRAFLDGDVAAVEAVLGPVRRLCDAHGALLKTILETGRLETPQAIVGLARLAVAGGADFLKTSTGKLKPAATPEATRLLLETARAAREAGLPGNGVAREVGVKPAGGIRTVADAAAYLALADEVMGGGWATPGHFRFGASGLLDALVAALDAELDNA